MTSMLVTRSECVNPLRNELVEELSNKTKKMNEAEVQLELMKTHTANNQMNRDLRAEMEDTVMKADLSAEIRRKDLEIEELRRHITSMEHILKEKTTLEDHLRKQVADMNKQQPHEVEVTLRAQIRDLQYAVKDLTEERAGLEKIIAQKTLELDQRDLVFKQHSQILRSKDELIPLIQNRKRYDEECLEKLRGFVFEHEKTYFNREMDNRFNSNDQYAYESANAVDKPYAFDPTMVDKEMSFRQEKMTELFNLLEQKQMEMMRLERRMRDLQGAQDQREKTVREQAACISSLQKALGAPNTNKSRGFFSLLSGQDSLTY
ncbi:myosin-7-like [Homalodisca vitripennis]|uniref:myosin-7-like n=1 Tax=Homalodisca vitripennis TaxID=197043 RepID=UPI001EEBCABD|nr:myosin-7-like [Homalodisca vitripennis]